MIFNVFLITVLFVCVCVLGEIQTRVPTSIWPVVSPLHESRIFTQSWSERDGEAKCAVRQLISLPLHLSPTREKRRLPQPACPAHYQQDHFLRREILRHDVSSLYLLAFLDMLKICNLLILLGQVCTRTTFTLAGCWRCVLTASSHGFLPKTNVYKLCAWSIVQYLLHQWRKMCQSH